MFFGIFVMTISAILFGVFRIAGKSRFSIHCNSGGFPKGHFAFLYEMRMWLGAKISAEAVSRTDLLRIPLSRKSTDGMIDSARARNMLFVLKQMSQMMQ